MRRWLARLVPSFGVDRHSTVNYVALWRSYVGRCHGLLGAGCPLYRCQRLCKGAPGFPSGHNGHGALHAHPYCHMPCHSRSVAPVAWRRSDIAPDASRYFAIFCMSLPVYQLGILSSSMLKSSGNMRVPSAVSVLMCLLDVVFNYFLIFSTRHVSVLGYDILMPGMGMGVAGAALERLLHTSLRV